MGIDEIKQIVDDVQGEIKEVLDGGNMGDPMIFGQLLAYAETLSIIKCACAGEEDKIGLDYDIDAKIFTAKSRRLRAGNN